MKVAIYISGDTAEHYSICGRFLDDAGVPTPVCFYGNDRVEVQRRMASWLDAERKKEADKDRAREYLRTPEAIEKRRLAMAEARAKRAAEKAS